MLNRLIEQIYIQIVKHKYKDFRRGKCKQCLFFSVDAELKKEESGYCIKDNKPQVVKFTYKCGAIVKR